MTSVLAPPTRTRSLHLVDLENLVGDPMASGPTALDALHRYLAISGWRTGDEVILAANPGLLRQVMFDLPVPCSVHAVTGTDAADFMLLAYAEPARVAARFGRLVVGSGDGEFAPTALEVRDRGVPVVVVALHGCLSQTLQGQGFGIRFMPAPSSAVTLAA